MSTDRNGFPSAAWLDTCFGGNAPDRVALINARIDRFIAAGWRRRGWHATSPGSPGVTWERFGGRRFPDILNGAFARYLDHHYRLISPDAIGDRRGLRTIWVTEPYADPDGPEAGALRSFLGQEWQVRVVPDATLWNPGGTTAIWMARAEVPLVPPWGADLVSAHWKTVCM